MFTWLTNDRALTLLILSVLVLLGLVCWSHSACAQEEDWRVEPVLPMCPVDYYECVERDFVAELERAHMLDPNTSAIGVSVREGTSDRRRRLQPWELVAINIIMSVGRWKIPYRCHRNG